MTSPAVRGGDGGVGGRRRSEDLRGVEVGTARERRLAAGTCSVSVQRDRWPASHGSFWPPHPRLRPGPRPVRAKGNRGSLPDPDGAFGAASRHLAGNPPASPPVGRPGLPCLIPASPCPLGLMLREDLVFVWSCYGLRPRSLLVPGSHGTPLLSSAPSAPHAAWARRLPCAAPAVSG